MTAEDLRSALSAAMFSIDMKVQSACRGLETKLGDRIGGVEQRMRDMGAAVAQLEAAQQVQQQQQQQRQKILLQHAQQTKERQRAAVEGEEGEEEAESRSAGEDENNRSNSSNDENVGGGGTEVTAGVPMAAASASLDEEPPLELHKWGWPAIEAWLGGLGLSEDYGESLRLVGVGDAASLLALTAADLEEEELGVEPADAAILVKALEDLKQKAAALAAEAGIGGAGMMGGGGGDDGGGFSFVHTSSRPLLPPPTGPTQGE